MDIRSLADIPTCNEPARVLAHSPASLSCLAVSVLPIPCQARLVDDFHPSARVLVAQQGSGLRWYRRGAQTAALRTAPRMIEMYEGGLGFDQCDWEGEIGRCAMIEFDDASVDAITHGELKSLHLRTRHEVFDERVSTLALELAEEALRGHPNGRLYAQGLSVALLGLLANRYQEPGIQPAPARTRQLGAAQKQRLVELIRSEPALDLSVRRLADEVGLSPYHFARVFKASFGTSPHRYVQSQRLDAAAKALRADRTTPIADIALEHGFANQSHMTELMRRRWGITPRKLRDG